MHAPDGFLNAATAVTTGAVSVGLLTATVRNIGTSLKERQAPLAGVVAAFVFAAQMVNFPVAAGTSGHLLGGALAAVLLGPAVGSVVATVVVVVQALVFADGGLTALGYNIVNMALVTAFGGYAAFWLFRKVLPANRGGVIGAAGLGGGGFRGVVGLRLFPGVAVRRHRSRHLRQGVRCHGDGSRRDRDR